MKDIKRTNQSKSFDISLIGYTEAAHILHWMYDTMILKHQTIEKHIAYTQKHKKHTSIESLLTVSIL